MSFPNKQSLEHCMKFAGMAVGESIQVEVMKTLADEVCRLQHELQASKDGFNICVRARQLSDGRLEIKMPDGSIATTEPYPVALNVDLANLIQIERNRRPGTMSIDGSEPYIVADMTIPTLRQPTPDEIKIFGKNREAKIQFGVELKPKNFLGIEVLTFPGIPEGEGFMCAKHFFEDKLYNVVKMKFASSTTNEEPKDE